jgi:Domain of unknown function (DUF4398)
MLRITNGLAVIALASLMTACASAPANPTADLTRARTLIEQAENDNTRQFAAAELEQARDKLGQAERAAEDGREAEADRLAMQAALDAEYARVKAGTAAAVKAADELDRSTDALRQETKHD